MLLEKQHLETLALFSRGLLGSEDSVARVLEELPQLESMAKQSFQKLQQVMHQSKAQEKKDILRFFKWSIKNGKTLEALRQDLTLSV